MINFKKITAFVLITILIVCQNILLTGCASDDYPVKVGNITFESSPENVVVLSENVADIIMAIGYETKLVGRSDECDQKILSIVPSVGAKITPNVSAIVEAKCDVVFADDSLDIVYENQLKEADIKIVKILPSKTKYDLEMVYRSIGKVLGGKTAGAQKADEAFKGLFSTIEDIVAEKGDTSFVTVCYLYLENSKLKTFSSNSYGNLLFELSGATSVGPSVTTAKITGSEKDDGTVDSETLKRSNPTYLFYSDPAVITHINADPALKELSAIKTKQIYIMPLTYFSRQGDTALEAVNFICEKSFPNSASNDQASTIGDVVDISTVADKYNIKITDDMQLKPDDENNDVMALQKRLDDLGYMTVEPTGFFGELTTAAIKDFQSNNSMEQTGKATADVLKSIFSTDAVKRPEKAR